VNGQGSVSAQSARKKPNGEAALYVNASSELTLAALHWEPPKRQVLIDAEQNRSC
jgi:hypothetical protein